MPASEHIDVRVLQREIEEHARSAGPEPPFYQLHLRTLIPIRREAVRVEPAPPLIGRTPYERLWVVINSIVRHIVRHGVEPAVHAQNASNSAVEHMLDLLMANDDALHAEIVRLRAEEQRETS